jgi:hypothetical protein
MDAATMTYPEATYKLRPELVINRTIQVFRRRWIRDSLYIIKLSHDLPSQLISRNTETAMLVIVHGI